MRTILINGKLYSSGYLVTTANGQKILKEARDERQTISKPNIFCICNGKDNPIPMHAKQKPNSNSFTLGRNPYTQHLHSPECSRYLDILDKVETSKDYDENKEITAIKTKDRIIDERWETCNLYGSDYLIREEEEREPNDKEYERNHMRTKYTKLFQYLQKITAFAWYKYVTNPDNHLNPLEGNLFHIIYTQLSNEIVIMNPSIENEKKLDEHIELQKVLFKPYKRSKNEDITKLLLNKRRVIINNKLKIIKTLIIGKYLEHEVMGDQAKIKLLDPYQKNYYYILGTINQLNRILKRYIEGADLYIAAYIINANNKPIVDKIDSMPVLKNRGIFVESKYEITFANNLISKKELFVRPIRFEYQFMNIFKKYIPDFIVLDKQTRKFKTISEVFGYKQNTDNERNIQYWIQTNNKLEFYKELKNKYNFVHWYAADGQDIKKLKF